MNETDMENDKSQPEETLDGKLSRKELQAWGSKIIAEARRKDKKTKRIYKKNRISRKEYIENMTMKEKWWSHYGRGPWY